MSNVGLNGFFVKGLDLNVSRPNRRTKGDSECDFPNFIKN